MESIFMPGALEGIASSDALLAFDFDGTLAPLVDDPGKAAMRPETRRLLAQVAQRYPCAVISGRREEDVLSLLGGVTVWYVVGNRALQSPEQVQRLTAEVRAWQPVLTAKLSALPGVTLEDKGVSIAVHHRHSAQHDVVVAEVRAVAAALGNARAVIGKDVVNLIPDDAAGKGAALSRIVSQLGCARALYTGDDGSDEDAFAVQSVCGVRVGRADSSRARFFIHDQAEVDELLARLAALRDRRTPTQEASARLRSAI